MNRLLPCQAPLLLVQRVAQPDYFILHGSDNSESPGRQAAAPPGSGINRDELLDRLLESLDGPEALEVYNRLIQMY